MDFLEYQISKITDNTTKIVYPEGKNASVIRGVSRILELGAATPILLGEQNEIEAEAERLGVSLAGAEYISLNDPMLRRKYAGMLAEEKGLSVTVAELMLKKPLYLGAMIVKNGDADCIIAGIEIETGEVVAAYKLIIGMEDGIQTPSCISFVETAHYSGHEGNVMAMADMAITVDPTAEELADIVLSSASSVKYILEWEPRIAMLSFSTVGSSNHSRAKKIAEAVQIVKSRVPGLKIDGEMQLDAAVVPEVAARKVKRESDVAGKANVLIFPNLDASNIGIKLLQRLGGAMASGGVLQGFAKPVCDLSRGATEENVLRNSVMIIRYCRSRQKDEKERNR